MKITDDQVRASEEVASDVYDKHLTATEGATLLANVHGININSARDFINDYRYMMQGRVFQRAMSAPAINYFLSKILEKRGIEAHSLAVSAVDQHINYYEQLSNVTLHSMRAILEAHAKKSAPIELAKHIQNFTAAVQESLKDSSSARAARLSKAAKLPTKVPVVSYAFVRNPDVVAEVLLRAFGKCERCKESAPFKRKKDSQPYLEVHHIIQLSQGGEDTVSNALALCPNCHRYLHFGLLPDHGTET
jgi:5-methylcytosine-specific restriction protein A